MTELFEDANAPAGGELGVAAVEVVEAELVVGRVVSDQVVGDLQNLVSDAATTALR